MTGIPQSASALGLLPAHINPGYLAPLLYLSCSLQEISCCHNAVCTAVMSYTCVWAAGRALLHCNSAYCHGTVALHALLAVLEASVHGAQIPYCVSLAWSADGATLYSGYTDGIVRVWGVGGRA